MAYYNLEDSSNPILQIQRLLRNIDRDEAAFTSVAPSGSFESNTRDAVIRFQDKYGLRSTGVVDKETWDLLHRIDSAKKKLNSLVQGVKIFPQSESYNIPFGSRNDLLYIIQIFLNEIANEYDSIEMLELNGIYNTPTQNAIKAFQRAHLIEDNGKLDAETINLLFKEYERINNRQG